MRHLARHDGAHRGLRGGARRALPGARARRRGGAAHALLLRRPSRERTDRRGPRPLGARALLLRARVRRVRRASRVRRPAGRAAARVRGRPLRGREAAVSDGDVTVVIACFDYGRYLREAVDSAVAQAGAVVVVDDGSTDDETVRVLDSLRAGVEVVRQRNQGVCRARNAGLARVETPYALVLDADDRLAP